MSGLKTWTLSELGSSVTALALVPAWYVWAAACLIADIAEVARPSAPASAFLLASSWSVYLADRAKWRDAWFDPADEAANPTRARWIWSHRRAVRVLALFSALAGTIAACMFAPVLAPAPLGGQIAVWLYAGTPHCSHASPRFKDFLLVKNLAAAAGLLTLSVSAVMLDARAALPDLIRHAGLPALIVITCDCVLCDIPDRQGDAAFGTRTIPVAFGVPAARISAAILTIAAGAWLQLSPSPADHVWAWGLALTSWPLAMAPSPWLRPLTDLRLPMIALAAAWI
ncbi:MAG: hypothetical protein Kow0022_11040 [Phycisphaerales bacterium]